MKTNQHILLLGAFCLLTSFMAFSQPSPQNGVVDWTQAGLLNDIPTPSSFVSVSDFGAIGDGFSDDTQAVLDALEEIDGENAILYFPSGTYLLSQSINCYSGLTIRGQGSNETHLKFFLNSDSQNAINISEGQNTDFVPINSGYGKGSQVITVDDASEFQAGEFLEIKQENGDWDISPASWAANSVGQVVQIESINGGEISLKNALRFTYTTSLNPVVRKIQTIQNVLIENLKVERMDAPSNGGGKNIYLAYAVNCQVSGLESVKSQGSHLYATVSSNLYVFGNYFHDSFLYDGAATRGYGVTLNMHTGEVLVENNIFKNLRHAMVVKTGANGNVFSYNYSREPHRSEPISDYSGDISVHGHYAYANLFEENIVQNIIIDHYWGPGGPCNTFFRNRTELYGFIMTSNSELETSEQNIVGNEITNSFPYGFYAITGQDHLEYGNNDGGTAVPQNTEDFNEASSFYSDHPWFLESSYPFPGIGYPNTIGQWSIPAKDRYEQGDEMTVIIENTVGIDIELPNQKEEFVKIKDNSVQDFLEMKIATNEILQYSIFNISGQELLSGELSNRSGDSKINISRMTSNMYLVRFNTAHHQKCFKFFKE